MSKSRKCTSLLSRSTTLLVVRVFISLFIVKSSLSMHDMHKADQSSFHSILHTTFLVCILALFGIGTVCSDLSVFVYSSFTQTGYARCT